MRVRRNQWPSLEAGAARLTPRARAPRRPRPAKAVCLLIRVATAAFHSEREAFPFAVVSLPASFAASTTT